MKKNKKTDRTQNTRFLSVVPVTTRAKTGTDARHTNLRAALKAELARESARCKKSALRVTRLIAAIKALGKANDLH
jgi:hypothetical protein